MFKFQSFFSPRKWNTWSEGVETPLHLLEEFCTFHCVISLEGHPVFKGEPMCNHEHRSYKRREGSGSLILLFCGWSSQKKGVTLVPVPTFWALSVFWGIINFKCPHMPLKNGHKGLPWFQWLSSNRKAVLPTQLFCILAFSLES